MSQQSALPQVPAGRHDPEGRRRQIVLAAAQLIPEVGLAKLTHRLVAQRAGVSLGSTTRYFASLDELRKAALEALSAQLENDLDHLRGLAEAEGCTPKTITKYLTDFLADADNVRMSTELFSAASADPELRSLANRWDEGLIAILAPHFGADAAQGIVLLLDGATVHASSHDQPLDDTLLQRYIHAMCEMRPR